ncbi:NADH pyrophosphatase [Corynebacterium atrinae]|uniref:NAD(+) diphosphatase n=1 Tax=Corynebacterium atrinae TaxID=1336740 RepID=UPI0025B3BEEB|nr:NAD(+) diphosphatase [Corynebacterium atrinae]WJY62728.1 NADH pyrophosphatase [Corynebacterium atrinae]
MRDYLPVDPTGHVPVDAADRAVRLSTPPSPAGPAVHLGGGRWAVRVADVSAYGERVRDARFFGHDREVSRAIALLRHRDGYSFDPVDGSPLTFDDEGIRAAGASGRPLFPRVNPAVIGLVHLAGAERILLGRNAARGSYFSLIAGYVDAGENLEEAFAREVWEEVGRRVTDVTYWGSQPWAISGSLMVGFTAITSDREAVGGTDGEIIETRWVSREELADLPLAPPGSIAHAMISDWRDS